MFMRFSTGFIRNIVLSAAMALITVNAYAQQPSAAQIEQFKQLPRAQQEALAKQYGVDLSQLQGGASSSQLQEPVVSTLQQGSARSEQINERVNTTKPAGLQRFGESLFDANISTFAPVSNAPVPTNYRLGPDDTLLVQVYGKQNNDYELVVSREGNINLPDLGPINVAGLTYAEASSLIRNRLTEANIGLQAAVTMGQLRTINIFVAGEARNPGMYAVSALTSITQALFVSGGVSDIGSLRNIKVTRAGSTVAQFDLYDLLLKGQNSNDIILQHGDVVFISPIGDLVTIEGEVRRPAHYELAKGENLSHLIAMAGGLQPQALTNAISLQRATPAGRELLTIDYTVTAQHSLALKAGDKVLVPQLSNRIREQISIIGAVTRPGTFAWSNGLQLHHVLTNPWTDLLNTTDTQYALLLRKTNFRGDIQVIEFNLINALQAEAGMPMASLSLAPQDIVLVFNKENSTYQRDVLNSYIRSAVQGDLSQFASNALLSGDIAADNFATIQARNAVIGSSQFNNNAQALTAENIVENFVANMLEQMYVNKDFMAYSKHLNRREMLYPLLQMLRKQSNDQQEVPVVSISGDVKVPGEYPLTQNADIRSLVTAAGGLNSSAFLNRAELSRFVAQQRDQIGIQQQNINVNLAAILSQEQPDIALTSRDRLNIFSIPDWSQVRLVNVQGEVRFPGTYQVLKGEKLSDVIKRAGGLTDDAYAFGAVFTRDSIKQREQRQASRLLEQLKADIASKALTNSGGVLGGAATPPPLGLIDELQTIEPVGRMVVNLDNILIGRSDYDLELEANDAIFIPRNQTSITVMGEVQHPGSHRFQTGLTVKDYLALAGGSRKRADANRAYVIRADGSVMIPSQNRWFGASSEALKPGDTIIMPLDTEYKDSLGMWAQVTQIFYQTAVAIAALNSF